MTIREHSFHCINFVEISGPDVLVVLIQSLECMHPRLKLADDFAGSLFPAMTPVSGKCYNAWVRRTCKIICF